MANTRKVVLNTSEWEQIRAYTLGRMQQFGIPASNLVAIRVEYPDGSNGAPTCTLPASLRLTLKGLRLQGYVIPHECVIRTEELYKGLPLVIVQAQYPVHTRDEEVVRGNHVYRGMSTRRTSDAFALTPNSRYS